MNDVMYQVGVQIGAYLVLTILILFALNWMTNGFLFPAIRVKLSRGKKILVSVRGIGGSYYRACKITGGFLKYKDTEKNTHLVSIDNSSFIDHIGGTKAITVDEQTDIILSPDLKGGEGFDGVKYENLYLRALMSPNSEDKIMKLILIVAIIAAGASALALWLIYNNGHTLTQILELSQKAAGAVI